MSCRSCGKGTVGVSPFYEEVDESVLEDHKTVISDTCYAVGVRTPEDWNIPEVDSDISVKIADVTNIPVGTYLYNPAYGFLKITNWNPKNETIGVLNEGIVGTAAPGSSVPLNTLFVITAKPCCEDNTADLFPYLAADFNAPDSGQSVTIEVTSTFGLQLGSIDRIGTGLYRLTQINSSRQIVITNEGAGATPGDLVEALDAEGEYQYLIVAETASACAAADVELGRLIACSGSTENILSGNYAGQVPVLQDASSSEVAFEFLDADVRVCTELSTNMVVVSATADYVINVGSVAGFVIGDLIQLNFNTLRFEITAIGTNTFDISSTPGDPGVDTTILAGSAVCKILTSEVILAELSGEGAGLQSQINNLQTQIDNLNSYFSTLAGNLTLEISARTAADAAITTAYGLADTTLQTNITNEAATRSAAITTEATARAAADLLLVKVDGSNATGIVLAAWLASNSVTTIKIADSNVTTAKIADSNVTTVKIADSNVTTAKIADGAVTEAKLDDNAASRSTLLGSWSIAAHASGATSAGSRIGSVGYTTTLIIPKNVTFTHMSLASTTSLGSGSLTAKLLKNNVTQVGAEASILSGTFKGTAGSFGTTYTAVAGDYITINFTDTHSATPVDAIVDLWGHFTG